MHFSEYDRIDANERRVNRKLVNSLSQIPMFDQIKYSGEAFYKTSYGEQFPSKERFFGKEPDANSHYDYQGLSARLANRNGSLSSRPSSSSKHHVLTDSINDLNSDSYSQLYKRPQIPPYIKRDNFFQTNAEKNISYLQTHTGVFPFVKNRDYKRKLNGCDATFYFSFNLFYSLFYIEPSFLPINKPNDDGTQKQNSLVNFYSDKRSEFQSSYNTKEVARANMSSDLNLLKKDNTYHTNSEKNIRYIRTSNGSIITFVPNSEEIRPELANDFPSNSMNNLKHGNPKNQFKRNFSQIVNIDS